MKKQGLLLGTEGVLCSTVRLHRQAWETVLSLNQIPCRGIENLDFTALSREEGLDALLELSQTELSPAEKAVLLDEKNEQYRQLLANVDRGDLLPGVEALLEALRKRGIRLCVVTRSRNAVLILCRLGLEEAFDAVCDGNDRPSGDLYHYAARLLGLPPRDCLVWENSEFHRQTAKNMGFDTVCGAAEAVRSAIG